MYIYIYFIYTHMYYVYCVCVCMHTLMCIYVCMYVKMPGTGTEESIWCLSLPLYSSFPPDVVLHWTWIQVNQPASPLGPLPSQHWVHVATQLAFYVSTRDSISGPLIEQTMLLLTEKFLLLVLIVNLLFISLTTFAHPCTCTKTQERCRVSFSSTLHLMPLRHGLSLNLNLIIFWLGWWLLSQNDLPIPVLLSAGVTGIGSIITPSFLYGFQHLNSGSQACIASALTY